jgi:hypothetical protein
MNRNTAQEMYDLGRRDYVSSLSDLQKFLKV